LTASQTRLLQRFGCSVMTEPFYSAADSVFVAAA
jgi:hypothetical protein